MSPSNSDCVRPDSVAVGDKVRLTLDIEGVLKK